MPEIARLRHLTLLLQSRNMGSQSPVHGHPKCRVEDTSLSQTTQHTPFYSSFWATPTACSPICHRGGYSLPSTPTKPALPCA